MEIVAKKSNERYQTLEEHTQWVVEEALNQIDPQILHKVSTCTGWSEQKIRDLIFFSAYFHDIGKATVEFQETINNNGKKSYHPLYGASLLLHIKDFIYKDIGENNLTQTASCKYGLKVALDSIKSRGRRDYGARYYNSLLFN